MDPRRIGSRSVFILDSGAVVGALAKGRSSARLLNRELQKVSAICFAGGFRHYYVWRESAANPSDEPSRTAGLRPINRPQPSQAQALQPEELLPQPKAPEVEEEEGAQKPEGPKGGVIFAPGAAAVQEFCKEQAPEVVGREKRRRQEDPRLTVSDAMPGNVSGGAQPSCSSGKGVLFLHNGDVAGMTETAKGRGWKLQAGEATQLWGGRGHCFRWGRR